MEAVAAVSLAANVAQFIQIGSKFVSEARAIYRTSQGSRGALPDLLARTSALQTSLKSIRSGLEKSIRSSLEVDSEASTNDEALAELVKQCAQTAAELDESLQAIHPAGKPRRRDALRSAWRSVWREEQISALETRMNGLNGHLTVALLASLRGQAEQSLHQQQSTRKELLQLRDSCAKLEGRVPLPRPRWGASVPPFLDAFILKTDPAGYEAARRQWQERLVDEIHKEGGSSPQRIDRLPVLEGAHHDRLVARILRQFEFEEMDDRENRIPKAFEDTFEWLLREARSEESQWSDFRTWLASDGRLYWISGKPGSGKSTLMKFICSATRNDEEPRHLQYLKKWSGNVPLYTASFYFWNSGSEIQMSQKGLVNTLLHQLLSQSRHLIPSVLPAQWETMYLFGHAGPFRPSRETDLRRLLVKVVTRLSLTSKVCLFIDGLDEFAGSHDGLIDLIRDLTAINQVKICVASRPWVVFEKALAKSPMLRLQDLTYPDILHFVTARFTDDPGFARLQQLEPEYAKDLIKNVVSKADGVFLWVRVVVSSLLAGMSQGDRVSDLQRRLDLLPPDLEDLFDKILSSLEPFYLSHAAQLFKLVQSAELPLSALELYYADEEDTQVVLNMPVKILSADEEAGRIQAMCDRLNSRCKGLLEVISEGQLGGPTSTVQYLHRTVKDYIERGKARQTLEGALDRPFDPMLRLCAGHLAALKTGDPAQIQIHAIYILVYAGQTQPTFAQEVTGLLDELDHAAATQVKSLSDDALRRLYAQNTPTRHYLDESPFSHVISLEEAREDGNWVAVHSWGSSIDHLCPPNLLSLAMRYEVFAYVKAKLPSDCVLRSARGGDWPLLADALRLQPEARREITLYLLNNGADPNCEIPIKFPSGSGRKFGVWHLMLYHMMQQSDSTVAPEITPEWQEIAAAMLHHGASCKFSVVKQVADKLGPVKSRFTEVWNKKFHRELLKYRQTTGLESLKNHIHWHTRSKRT